MRRVLRRHPWIVARATITGKSVRTINTPRLAREAFFSAHVPEADVARFAARFGEESRRAMLDMMSGDLPRPHLVAAPLLVAGAEHDGSITSDEVRATARAYRTEAVILPGVGHDMMLEPGWPAAVELIDTWLAARGL